MIKRQNIFFLIPIGFMVFAYIFLIFKYHKSLSIDSIPWHDGSHHFTLASNFYNSIKAKDFLEAKSLFLNFPELALPYSLISTIFFLTNRISHFAIPVLYVLFFLSLISAYHFSLEKSERIRKTFLFMSLFILSGLYITHVGGAFDTRIDLFAVSSSSICLILLVHRKFYLSILFFVISAYLKGAAFFLLGPILVLGFLFQNLIEKIKVSFDKKFLFQTITILIPFLFFMQTILVTSLSYNLMKTGGDTLQNRFEIFIANMNLYLIGEFGFYFRALREYTNIVLIYILSGLVFFVSIFQKSRNSIIFGMFAILVFIFTYFLLTISPLKDKVLIIWFLPSTILMIVFITDLIFQTKKKLYLIFGILLAVLHTLYKTPQKYTIQEDYLRTAQVIIQKQTSEIASNIDLKFGRLDRKGIVFVNFLSGHGSIQHNYDSYTSLIHQKVKSATLNLSGWELSSYSQNWKSEIQQYKDYELIILVLQENPMELPAVNSPQKFGRQNYLELMPLIKTNPNCFDKIAETIKLPHIGSRDVFLVSNTELCKKILFQ